jgi:thioredoxin 1
MSFSAEYREVEPTRDEVNHFTGLLLLEFGASWCGHCIAISSSLEQVLQERPDVRHIRIADGRGKPLGRSFRVKLWPTLVLMKDGELLQELVRPTEDELGRLFAELPIDQA